MKGKILAADLQQQYDQHGRPSGRYLSDALDFQKLNEDGVDETPDYSDRFDHHELHPSQSVRRASRS